MRLFSSYRGLGKPVYYLFVARLVNSMGYFVTPLLTLILTQKIGMDIADAGGWVALIVLAQAPFLVAGGKLADIMGRKKLAVLSGLAGGTVFIICGASCLVAGIGRQVIWFFMAAAGFIIIGMPSWDALLADHTNEDNRRASFSLMYLGTNIGMAISPILAGLLFNDYLWLLFMLDGVSSIICYLIMWRNVPESDYKQHVAQSRAEQGGEAQGRHGESVFHVLRGLPVLVVFVILLFVFDFCYEQWSFMLAAQCGVLYGAVGAQRYSILSSENAILVIALTSLLTLFSKRFRPLFAVGLSGILYTVAYLGLGIVSQYPAYIVICVFYTLGEIMSAIQNSAFIADRSPAQYRGRINAFVNLVRGSSASLGPIIMGNVLAAVGYQASWLVIAALAAAATIAMFVLDRVDKRSSAKAQPSEEVV